MSTFHLVRTKQLNVFKLDQKNHRMSIAQEFMNDVNEDSELLERAIKSEIHRYMVIILVKDRKS